MFRPPLDGFARKKTEQIFWDDLEIHKSFYIYRKTTENVFQNGLGDVLFSHDVALMNAFHFSSSIVNDPSLLHDKPLHDTILMRSVQVEKFKTKKQRNRKEEWDDDDHHHQMRSFKGGSTCWRLRRKRKENWTIMSFFSKMSETWHF